MIERFKNYIYLNISKKVILIQTLYLITFIVGTIIYYEHSIKVSFHQSETNQAEFIAKTIADMITPSIELDLIDSASDAIEQIFSKNEDIVKIEIIQNELPILSKENNSSKSKNLFIVKSNLISNSNTLIGDENDLGYIKLFYSRHNYENLLKRQDEAITLFAVLSIIYSALLYKIIKELLNPIVKLSEKIKEFNPNNPKLVVKKSHQTDEAGVIQNAIYSTIKKVISTNENLKRLNSELNRANNNLNQANEHLNLTNDNLEQRVKERTKEIKLQNRELTRTLDKLEKTQKHLIASEKLSALGQLVASVAHEINSPLGAINSSIDNIFLSLDSLNKSLSSILKVLSTKEQILFFELIEKSEILKLSTVQKRKLRRNVSRELTLLNISNARVISDYFIRIGITKDIDRYITLIEHERSEDLFDTVIKIVTITSSGETIRESVHRSSKIVRALKSYARINTSESEKKSVLLKDLLETSLTLYHNKMKHGISLKKYFDESLKEILCYPDELNQVFANIIQNALYAMNKGGTLSIEIKLGSLYQIVTIADTGGGIKKEIQGRVFEPFFTTKPIGEGSGLGLDIAKNIVEKHQGVITFHSIENQGSIFTIKLPI